MKAQPPKWTPDQFTADAAASKELFREQRIDEPLEQYLELFEHYRQVIEELIELTVDTPRTSRSTDPWPRPGRRDGIRLPSGALPSAGRAVHGSHGLTDRLPGSQLLFE